MHVVRDLGPDPEGRRLNADGPRLGHEGAHAAARLLPHEHGGADSRVAREGNLRLDGEDVHVARLRA